MTFRSLLSLLALALLASKAQADPDPYFTTQLPVPDRAEVVRLEYPGAMEGPTVTLKTDTAHAMAKLVREQTWFGTAANCDKAQYILRFYSGKTLQVSERICFNCGCLAPEASGGHLQADLQSFDISTPKAVELRKLIERQFRAED